MIGVTAFGLFLTPVFYVLLRALAGNRPLKQHGEATTAVPVASPACRHVLIATGGPNHHLAVCHVSLPTRVPHKPARVAQRRGCGPRSGRRGGNRGAGSAARRRRKRRAAPCPRGTQISGPAALCPGHGVTVGWVQRLPRLSFGGRPLLLRRISSPGAITIVPASIASTRKEHHAAVLSPVVGAFAPRPTVFVDPRHRRRIHRSGCRCEPRAGVF